MYAFTDMPWWAQAASGSALSPAKQNKVAQTAARQHKKQKRRAEEGQLAVKRQEMDKAKVRIPFSYQFVAYVLTVE